MAEMTWPEVKKSAENGDIVIFPIAVLEEHGPHMDLTPDIYETVYMCRIIKQDLKEKKINSVIAPPYYWGINKSTGKFPGSFTVSDETFKAILLDTCRCLMDWGYKKIFMANLHGDPAHNVLIVSSVNNIRKELGIDIYYIRSIFMLALASPGILPPRKFRPRRADKFGPDYHAGSDETAMMWALYPDKVKVKEAENLKPQFGFEPLGYAGDPASFRLDKESAIDFIKSYAKGSSSAIEAVLKQKIDIP